MSCDKENIKKFVAKKYIINSLKSLCMWHRNINNVRNFMHNLYLKTYLLIVNLQRFCYVKQV